LGPMGQRDLRHAGCSNDLAWRDQPWSIRLESKLRGAQPGDVAHAEHVDRISRTRVAVASHHGGTPARGGDDILRTLVTGGEPAIGRFEPRQSESLIESALTGQRRGGGLEPTNDFGGRDRTPFLRQARQEARDESGDVRRGEARAALDLIAYGPPRDR